MNELNLAGRTFGEYELQELIGRGGMGTVYRAYQPSLKRDVAVKVLSFEFAARPGYIRRFTREAQMVAVLQHPHILPVQYYGVQDGTSYMVMPLLTGGTLARYLSRCVKENKPLPSLESIAVLLKQVAGALDYAHSQGVIHRDIKPNNIMFDNRGNAYLMDFGIAKLTSGESDLTSTGLVVGAPQYIPPEQWRGDELTPSADIYALGATVYAMLTGRAPFEAETPHAMMHKHLYEFPVSPQNFREDVPDTVIDVVMKAMSKEPEDRYACAEDFAAAFERAIRTDITPQLNESSPPTKKLPFMWGLGIIIGLLFVILMTLLLSRESPNVVALQPALTETASPVPSDTPLPSATSIMIAIPTVTPIDPTATPSSTPLPPMETAALTTSPVPSDTPLPSATSIIIVIPTVTPIDPTATPSSTPTETATFIITMPSATSTSPATETPTVTPTNTITPSNTPSPTATPVVAFGDTLFADNFEGESLTGWNHDPSTAWVVNDGGNRVLRLGGSGWTGVGLANGNSWINYGFEARIKIIKSAPAGRFSDVNLNVRNHANGNFVGWISAASNYATLGQNSNGSYRNIGPGYQLPLSTGIWYSLRVEADGSVIRMFLNDTLMAFAQDNNPTNGTILITASPGAEFYIDDVRVISLDRSNEALASARKGAAMTDLRIRSGPGTDYYMIDGLKPGDQVFIISRNPDQSWVYIRKDDNSGTQGWVSAQYIQMF